MKKYLFAIFLSLATIQISSSQVDNYALNLSNAGTVTFASTAQMDELQSYTIQFWIHVTTWSPGAIVFERKQGVLRFAIELGTVGELKVVNSAETFTAKSSSFTVGKWFQVTLMNQGGVMTAFLDNQVIGDSQPMSATPVGAGAAQLGGNGFVGRIDEFRVWNVAIADPFYRLWRNTVNKFHPNWSNLVLYAKFDQFECPNVVDYKFNSHGTFSATGATREKVTDNAKFKYLKHAAYSTLNRWFDCQIDHDRFLLANELILLIANVNAEGEVSLPYSVDNGVIMNGGYEAAFAGQMGVLKLNGVGAQMEIDSGAFNPLDAYTFLTKLYLNEWTEGAYIFRKESADNMHGFSIRLGKYDDKRRVYVRVNGVDYSFINRFDTGRWIDFGISTLGKNEVNKVYRAVVDGVEIGVNNVNQSETKLDYTVNGLENLKAYVGINIAGYFEETAIWHTSKDAGTMAGYLQNGNPLPSEKVKVEAATMWPINAYWRYDRPAEVGYDTYSWKGFLDMMKDHYTNYRGIKYFVSLGSFTGWESKFAEATFRTKFALSVAALAEHFDGVDLDFEWCYSQACWDNYGEVIKAIKAVYPVGKSFSITPHKVSYSLQPKYMEYCDHFLFQIYGPSKDIFLWSSYTAASSQFIAQGFPKEKIVMSYATTTSNAYNNATDVQISPVIAPVGVRSGVLLEDKYTWGSAYGVDLNGYRRYFTDPKQSIDRCEWVQDKGFGGIFYWDMGNDVHTSHKYSTVKHASFSINSNVDTIIRQVDMSPSSLPTTPIGQKQMRLYSSGAFGNIVCVIPEGFTGDTITVYSVEGKPLYQQSINQQTMINLPLNHLKKGFYLVELCENKRSRIRGTFALK